MTKQDTIPSGKVITILGPVNPENMGITDAHNHIWIEPVSGSAPGTPVLTGLASIQAELNEYHQSGGSSQIDCQPGGAGRNGNKLYALSRASRVNIVACTGYHLKKYYPPDFWLFSANTENAAAYFNSEIIEGLEECRKLKEPIRAGFIKIACQATLNESPLNLMEAAAESSSRTGAAIEIHTEKGISAENYVSFFSSHGVSNERLILCHMDKRPDIGLHRELAKAGVILEFDTFFRPKYHPEESVWPLIEKLCEDGLSNSIALATDLADSEQWNHLGKGPGLVGFVSIIRECLFSMGLCQSIVNDLTGTNISRRLAMKNQGSD